MPKSTLDWDVESLRLTVFFPDPEAAAQAPSLKSIAGGEPDHIETRPRESFVLETAEYGSGTLQRSSRLARTDWRLAPKPLPAPTEDLPLLGRYAEVLAEFQEPLRSWLDEIGDIDRLAFGVVLLKPVQERTEGYNLLQGFLESSVKLDTKASRDFFYQINRQRRSAAIEGLHINRLSKWSVLRMQHVSMLLAATGRSEVQVSQPTDDTYACRLELDINTEADYPEKLPVGKLRDLMNELIDLATEIALTGDVP